LLRDLDATALDELLRSSRVKTARKGEFLFREGDAATEIYVLEHGRIKVALTDLRGCEVILRLATSSQAVGYIEALGGARHVVSAEAIEDSTAVAISAESLIGAILGNGTATVNGLRLLAEHVLEGWQLYQMLATEPAEQRIALMVLKLMRAGGVRDGVNTGVRLDVSHQEIAELAGTTSYTVSRVVAQWKRLGIVEVKRGRITILTPDTISALAGGIVTAVTERTIASPSHTPTPTNVRTARMTSLFLDSP